jgi:hypothetical protein
MLILYFFAVWSERGRQTFLARSVDALNRLMLSIKPQMLTAVYRGFPTGAHICTEFYCGSRSSIPPVLKKSFCICIRF